MCSTAFHMVADQVEAALDVPFLHLADVVAQSARARPDPAGPARHVVHDEPQLLHRPVRLARHRGRRPRRAAPRDRNRIIYDELVHGKVLDASRPASSPVIDELWDAGAQGVILGCTELELLVKQADAEIPVFPCTTLHVAAALDRALSLISARRGRPSISPARPRTTRWPRRRRRRLVVHDHQPRPVPTATSGSPAAGYTCSDDPPPPSGRTGGEPVGPLHHPGEQHLLERDRRRLHQSPAPRAARVGVAGFDPGQRPGVRLAEPAAVGRPAHGVRARCTSPRCGAVQLDHGADPAAWCSPSMFWVTTPSERPARSSRANARCAGVGRDGVSRELPSHLPRPHPDLGGRDVPAERELRGS